VVGEIAVTLTVSGETEARVSVDAPLRQRVQRDKVHLELAVWIRQHAARVLDDLRVSARVRTEIQPRLVVVVGVEIVPDRHLPLNDPTYLLHRLDGDLLRDDLLTWRTNSTAIKGVHMEQERTEMSKMDNSGHGEGVFDL